MDIKQALVEAFVEVPQMFGLSVVFEEEIEEGHQFNAEQVSVLIGLTDGLKGNIVIGFNKNTALSIVSVMMGGMEVNELDFMAQSALGELANMTLGSALMKLRSEAIINLSPPTVVMGENMHLTVSGAKSRKLMFKINNEPFNIIVAVD